jgi:virginiamycin B lyase
MILAYRRSFFKKCSSFHSIILISVFLLLLLSIISFIFVQAYQENAMALSSSSIEEKEKEEEEQNNKLETFQKGFCGINSEPNSNQYIIEYVLPQTCEMPLGIAIDDAENKVWYVSTKKGLLGSYDLEKDKFNQEQRIPEWKVRESLSEFSQVWDIEVDNRRTKGGGEGGGSASDVWFTDEQQNAIWRYIKSSKTFEKYNIPGESESFGTTYPISIEFDPNNENIIYFVGTYSPSLWIADITEMKNGTSKGISEIHIPIEEGFKGIDPVYITTGSIAFDNKRDAIWISVLSYAAQKGQIFKYDLDTKSFDVYNLSEEEQQQEEGISSPWGIVVDDDYNKGDLWITNPGTSIFYKFDPEDNKDDDDDNINNINNHNIVKFVTSKTSSRVFGDRNTINNNSNISGLYKNSYTQPSWIKKSNEGSIWFNEQQGNKIAKFDPLNMKLIEYWVPTQNSLWGVCSSYYNNNNSDSINSNNNNNNNNNSRSINSISSNQTCGIANVLQFSIGQDPDGDDQVWFTEWSENKIGRLKSDNNKNLPFSIDIHKSDKELTVKRGESEKIEFRVKAAEAEESPSLSSSASHLDNIHMIASGTFTSTGDLGNSTGYFSKESISMDAGEEKEISFTFTPSKELKQGDYTLMIGAENDSISYLRAIKIKIKH